MVAIQVFIITIITIIIFGGTLGILLTGAFLAEKIEHDEMFNQTRWDEDLLHLEHPLQEPNKEES